MTVEWRCTRQELPGVAKWAKRVTKNILKAIKSWQRLMTSLVIHSYTGNPRVKHLALHARKARTRKKNYHRILRENRRDR